MARLDATGAYIQGQIDYTLLIVSRYRDELADGADMNAALLTTMTTAGRTVLVSATTVALSMAAIWAVPKPFRSSVARPASWSVARARSSRREAWPPA